MAYESYNAYLLSNGISNREKNLVHIRRTVETTFRDSPSYFQVLINSDFFDSWITDDSDVKDQKRIVTLDYPLKNGDIIDWQSSKWINILTDNMGSGIYYRGTLRRCVGQLKWVDDDGIVQSSYFTFKSDPATNFGVQDGRILTTGNERRNLIIKLDEHTAKFKKSIRFIFDSRAWKVTAIDTISVDGLSIITVDETEISEVTDNLELGVADYYGRVASYTLSILNEENFSIQAGKTLQLTVEVKNNGVVASRALSYSSSDDSIATVDDNGLVTTHANGNVVISVSLLDYPSITDSINGHVEFVTQNNYTVSLLEPPFVYMNKTKTFTIQVKNNGVIDSGKFVNWYLYDEDKIKTSTSYAAMVSSSTTQITLKGLDAGFVWLKVNIIGESQTYWIQVEVKSLI